MSTDPHPTVQLGDLVAVAFDWAAQSSSDPRNVPLLATKAVEHLLRRARKTSASRQATGLSFTRDLGGLLELAAAAGQPGVLASAGG